MNLNRICQQAVIWLLIALWWGAGGAGIAVMAPGCGKKGPPLPPIQPGDIPAAPTDLKYTLNGRQLTLSWRCDASLQDQGQNQTHGPRLQGVEVFMATKPLDGCQGCPFMFNTAGVVPMPATHFVCTLDQDVHYYFRVQALGHNNIKSKVSDTLYIELP